MQRSKTAYKMTIIQQIKQATTQVIKDLYQIELNITNSQVQDRLDAILNPLGRFHIDS